MNRVGNKIILDPYQILFKHNDEATNAYLIIKGAVVIYSADAVMLARLREGEIVGELSLGRNRKRDVFALADNSETILQVIDGNAIKKQLAQESFVHTILSQTQARLLKMNDKFNYIAKKLDEYGGNIDAIQDSELFKINEFFGIKHELKSISKNLRNLPVDAVSNAAKSTNTITEIAKESQKAITKARLTKDPVNAQDETKIIAQEQDDNDSGFVRLYKVDGYEHLFEENADKWEERSDDIRIKSFCTRAQKTEALFGVYLDDPLDCFLASMIIEDNEIILEIDEKTNKTTANEIRDFIKNLPDKPSLMLVGQVDDRFYKVAVDITEKLPKYNDGLVKRACLGVKIAQHKKLNVFRGYDYRSFIIKKGISAVNIHLNLPDEKLKTKAYSVAADRFELEFTKEPVRNVLYEGLKADALIKCQGSGFLTKIQCAKIEYDEKLKKWIVVCKYIFQSAKDETKAALLVRSIEREHILQEKAD